MVFPLVQNSVGQTLRGESMTNLFANWFSGNEHLQFFRQQQLGSPEEGSAQLKVYQQTSAVYLDDLLIFP